MRTVNGLEEARAALRSGAHALQSPPFAACHAGVGYYQALLAQLKSEFPAADFTFTLCCGDDPAMAHDALRMGFTSIHCQASGAVMAELQAVAAGCGATIHTNMQDA